MKIFSQKACTLGEGPLWSDYYQLFFWVDISEKNIYAKAVSSTSNDFDKCWSVDFIPTALLDNSADEETLWIVSDKGLFIFNPITGVMQKHLSFNFGKNFRTNDAGCDNEGNLWVGVMEKQPSGLNGYIFTVSDNGNIQNIVDRIGIPNTFCWSDELNAMLISDSYQKKMYAVQKKGDISAIDENPTIFDLTSSEGTPDGGALDTLGCLWNANWGLKRVIRHDFTDIVRNIPVNALNVTSVCFGDKNRDKLLITSSMEGLSEQQREALPHSGFTFLLTNTKARGRKPLGFAMKDKDNVS